MSHLLYPEPVEGLAGILDLSVWLVKWKSINIWIIIFKMKNKIFILLIAGLLLASPTSAKAETSFKSTLNQLKSALLNKDFKIINSHLALSGIIRSKVKKLSKQAQKNKSLLKRAVGKVAGFSEPLVTKATTKFVLREYGKSSRSLRAKYLKSLRFSKIKVKGKTAYAIGSFLGKPASVYAKKIKGKWVIVGVESPLIDADLKRILRLK